MAIITAEDLTSYPGIPAGADLDALSAGASDEVEGAWKNPVDPVPGWVKNIAKRVAARASINPKGLSMLSRQIDDAKRTEQFADASAGQVGYWLTAKERAQLAGLRRTGGARSIRTRPRGWGGS